MLFKASRLLGASIITNPGAMGGLAERVLMELEKEETKLAQEAGISLPFIEENCPAVCQGCFRRCKQILQAAETTINICNLFNEFRKLKEEALKCSHALIVSCVIRDFEVILTPVFSKIISNWFTTRLEKLKAQFENLKKAIKEQYPHFSEQRVEKRAAVEIIPKVEKLIKKTAIFSQPQETWTSALAIYHSIPHAELAKFLNTLLELAK